LENGLKSNLITSSNYPDDNQLFNDANTVIRKWLTSASGLVLFTLIAIVLIALLFDKSAYTQEEIDWCAAERPLVPMDICAREFGY